MRTIFKGGWQLVKVRFVAVLTLVFATFLVFAGVMIFREQGAPVPPTYPTDPIWGAISIVGGLALAFGIWYYCQVYISRVEISDDSRRLRLSFPGLLFPHRLEFGVSEVEPSIYHDGYSRTGGMTVNAPWDSVRIRGRRRFILDWQGDHLDEKAIDEFLLKPSPAPLLIPRRPRGGR